MEPRIQYAKTEDGVSIAFWTIGEGMPVVHMPFHPFSHLQMEWQNPEMRRWYERLADNRAIVRYDGRGMGLSEREVADFSLDAQVLDLEAVVGRLGLDRFALWVPGLTGPMAVAYAARYPERVSHLFLWNTATRISEWFAAKHIRAFEALLDVDWETATETWARVLHPGPDDEVARQHAAFARESTTPDVMRALLEACRDVDVRSVLPDVRSRTLVLSRRQIPNRDNVRLAKDLTSRIPDSRLVLMEGNSALPWLGDTDAVLQAIDEFLSEGEEAAGKALPQGTAIILFLDIAGSTALTTKLGDAAYRDKERELDASLRAAITGAAGTPVEGKVLGDGVMSVFTSARQAIDAAQRCRDLGNEAGLPLHIGVHAGDVVREVDSDGRANVHGGAVQVASRVQGVAAPGEILVSATVRDLARTSAGVEFEDRGEHELKGIAEPQRLFAVRAAAQES